MGKTPQRETHFLIEVLFIENNTNIMRKHKPPLWSEKVDENSQEDIITLFGWGGFQVLLLPQDQACYFHI